MKYIKFKRMGVVMFPDTARHSDMARGVDDTPMSAGFITIREDGKGVICYGYSDSLGLESSSEDSAVATRQFHLTS